MLQEIVDWTLYNLLSLDSTTKISQSINFFIYDSIKIILLLYIMIGVIAFLRTYISGEKIKQFLTKGGTLNYFIASFFGVITPFCSCSSLPIFISFLELGIPLGITLSFLITSPIVNEYLVILMLADFGWKITLAYISFGVFAGVFAGIVIHKFKLEKYLVKDFKSMGTTTSKIYTKFKDRITEGIKEANTLVKKLWYWILIGVGIGAIIHNYVPEEWITGFITKTGVFGVPIAVILGVPMYGSCAAIVPIAVALFAKGLPIGTALSFMMAISALSLPQAIILRRVMKLKLILIFYAIVTLAIILSGYALNFIQVFLS